MNYQITASGAARGPRGVEGVSAYELAVNNGYGGTETQWLASLVGGDGSRTYASGLGLYLPDPLAGAKWRRTRAAVDAGIDRAHIAVVGDSIAFGAAATGNTPPKNQTSWPGRLRAMLEQRDQWGGGWVLANAHVLANPTWDPRWTFAGTVTAPVHPTSGAFGFHKSATYRIASGNAANYVEFTDVMDKVQIWTAQGASGVYSVTIDGVSAGTVGNGSGVGTIAKVSDTAGLYAPSQEVTTEISCGTLGSHTVRITAPGGASQDTFLLGIKPIVSGNGRFEVSNASISTKSIYSLFSASAGHNDETNGLYGLPMIDFLKADLLVFALGINDWQFGSGRTLAGTLTDLGTVVDRQTSSGNAPTGAVKANGDVLLVWNPEPSASLNASDATWAEWRQGWYDTADTKGVPFLDLGMRWGGYAAGTAAGLFADTIHPDDDGALDIVSAVHEAVFHRI